MGQPEARSRYYNIAPWLDIDFFKFEESERGISIGYLILGLIARAAERAVEQ